MKVVAVETVTAVWVVDMIKRAKIEKVIWFEEHFFRLATPKVEKASIY